MLRACTEHKVWNSYFQMFDSLSIERWRRDIRLKEVLNGYHSGAINILDNTMMLNVRVTLGENLALILRYVRNSVSF